MPDLDELQRRGFTSFSDKVPSQSTLDTAQRIGQVLHAEGVATVQTLVPRNAEGLEGSSYSGLYGTSTFPLHTDMAHWHLPPRYFLLRCIEPAKEVSTYFASCYDIFGPEGELDLRRALFRPRRRLDGRLTCFPLRNGDCNRWDPAFIRPVSPLAFEIRPLVLDRIRRATVEAVCLRAKGDCLLVDNWKVLHGRSAIPHDATHRRLERVYLKSLNL